MGRAPTVSRFSSRGPDYIDTDKNPADVLKPNIIAPGHQIWAAWSPMSALDPILAGSDFGMLSGTSMATPHVAGIDALIKQLNPSWTPSMIASAMSTTAGSCAQSFLNPSDLNIPSVTLTALVGSRLVRWTVTNVARKTETYLCAVVAPNGVAVDLNLKWLHDLLQNFLVLTSVDCNINDIIDVREKNIFNPC